MSEFQKLLFVFFVIFKNAVMDEGNGSGAVRVRVGVLVGHAAVCGPAGVAEC